ncbi:MAG: hypothetical protein BGO11_20875 [Solirubrobacterales bacterium 70-9]|nr:MAG: hypothetical protein BGO11_20875 [Solirubrobacterales bacterium 70-9]
MIDWLLSLEIEAAPDQIRVPANPGLGVDARLRIRLRFDEALLGYLWLIDEPRLEDAEQLRLAAAYADQMAAELARARRLEDMARKLHGDALQRLLFGEDPETAADQLNGDGMLTGTGRCVALVARAEPRRSRGPGLRPRGRVHLSFAAEEVRRSISPNNAIVLPHQQDVVLAFACDDDGEPERRADALLAAARRQFAKEARGISTEVEVTVGVGGVREELAALRDSYREALLAVEVARRVPDLNGGSPLAWGDLGPYRTLTSMLDGRDPLELIPPSLADLLEERDGIGLVETLETYLESGCDAKAASSRLFVHRSSLYKRLQRIERLTGCDLHRGDDRLELHMGLRLWRLGGAGGGDDAHRPHLSALS